MNSGILDAGREALQCGVAKAPISDAMRGPPMDIDISFIDTLPLGDMDQN